MIYMLMISKPAAFHDKAVRGVVLYRGAKVEIPDLPSSFPDNFDYFGALLASSAPPPQTPRDWCDFCPITEADCQERVIP